MVSRRFEDISHSSPCLAASHISYKGMISSRSTFSLWL